MKKRMVTKILCLLLCACMILPIAASAVNLPVSYNPPVTGRLLNGITTNQMAYVDQFFTDSGGWTAEGRALMKWLDMMPREDGVERTNSGFLMLEKEMEYRVGENGSGYRFKKFATDWAKMTLTAFGPKLNIAIKAIEWAAFQKKFPDVGKDAYVYYNYLNELYIEYIGEMQAQVEEASKIWEYADTAFGAVLDLPHTLEYVNVTTLTEVKATDLVVVTQSTEGMTGVSKIELKKITVDAGSGEITVKFTRNGGSETFTQSAAQMLNDNPHMVISCGGSGKSSKEVMELLETARLKKLDEVSGQKTKATKKFRKIKIDQINELSNSLEHTDTFRKLPDKSQQALKKVKKWISEIENSTPMKKLKDLAQKLGPYSDMFGAAVDTAMYLNEKESITEQQRCYLNAMTNVTQTYINMLWQWREMMGDSNIGHKEDIEAALSAILKNIGEVYHAGVEKVEENAKADATLLTADDLCSALCSVAEVVVPGIQALSESAKAADAVKDTADAVKDTADAAKGTVEATGKASALADAKSYFKALEAPAALLSIGFDWATSDFCDFDERVTSVYNLKLSLYNLLVEDRNGHLSLFSQYRANRNHETAVQIIDALYLMRYAKVLGENLMDEYYLKEFYEDQDVKPSVLVLTLMRNEMLLRSGNGKLDAAQYITDIVGVYESTLTQINGEKAQQTVVLGYYLNRASDQVTYSNVDLKPFPAKYVNLSNKAPDNYAFVKNAGEVLSEAWLGGKEARGYDPERMYKISNLRLYSRNGVEVILSYEEYLDYLELQKAFNQMVEDYGDTSTINWAEWEENHTKKQFKEQQQFERMRWTSVTRRWIEKIEMYDPSISYPGRTP